MTSGRLADMLAVVGEICSRSPDGQATTFKIFSEARRKGIIKPDAKGALDGRWMLRRLHERGDISPGSTAYDWRVR